MTAPPLIGLTTAIEPRLASPGNDGAAVVRLPYLRQVALAGGVAVLLPPTAPAVAGPEHLLDRLDAVVLTGGPDIDPVHYGAERDPRTRVGPRSTSAARSSRPWWTLPGDSDGSAAATLRPTAHAPSLRGDQRWSSRSRIPR